MNNIGFYRNIGISAHIDAGKTTTTERILYYTGVSHKLGEVHNGEAVMDWMKQEQERGITITSAATTVFWNKKFDKNKYRINIIDTPGHVDFTIEVERCMRVIDSVCMVYCSVSGVQSQSETVWKQSNKYNIPKLIFVNKMDRDGSDFYNVYNQLINILKAKPLPIFIPYYFKNNFIGLIDLIKYKIVFWNDENKGFDYSYDKIPDSYIDISNKWRDNIINISTENNDFLIDKYLNNSLNDSDILNSLRFKTISCEIQPMLCGSAFKNKGIQCLLDSIIDFLPSPLDAKFVKGYDLEGNFTKREISENEKFCAFAFKIVNDIFVGQLIFFRVYSGVLNVGDFIYNPSNKKKEKLMRILQIHANNRVDIKKIGAGNIAAAIGLKSFSTGDTLCDYENPIILERISFPDPVISLSIEVKNKDDHEKIFLILNKFIHEDPSFKFFIDKDSNQIIISGMGELHLEIIIDRIKSEYDIELLISKPKVSYKETIKNSIKNIEGKYIRQSGGRGQYGHVVLDLEPSERGNGFKFIDKIKGGSIPKEYIHVIEKSIIESSKSGVLLGYPVLDINVFLVDGSFHEVDSSENAFKIAASIAFKDALRKANPILLEPIMFLCVDTPNDYTGIIIGNISSKRGLIINIEDRLNDLKLIKSEVPLSELFGYSTSLRSLTQGRASFNMFLKNYIEVPSNIFKNLF